MTKGIKKKEEEFLNSSLYFRVVLAFFYSKGVTSAYQKNLSWFSFFCQQKSQSTGIFALDS